MGRLATGGLLFLARRFGGGRAFYVACGGVASLQRTRRIAMPKIKTADGVNLCCPVIIASRINRSCGKKPSCRRGRLPIEHIGSVSFIAGAPQSARVSLTGKFAGNFVE
jgi:hypothetical protein